MGLRATTMGCVKATALVRFYRMTNNIFDPLRISRSNTQGKKFGVISYNEFGVVSNINVHECSRRKLADSEY